MCATSLKNGGRFLPQYSCFAEQQAVIGRKDDCGILPCIGGIEPGEQPAEMRIAHREKGVVIGAEFRRLGEQVIGASVARPVENGALVIGFDAIPLGGEERLVRIEAFDLEQPVVGGSVGFKKFECGGEALGDRELLLCVDVLPGDRVRERGVGSAIRIELAGVHFGAQTLHRRVHDAFPFVFLLAAEEFPGRIAAV